MSASNALKLFRLQWEGRTVKFKTCGMSGFTGNEAEGVVDGVGDDGARLDYDGRRKAKPTGFLFVKTPSGSIEDVHVSSVTWKSPLTTSHPSP